MDGEVIEGETMPLTPTLESVNNHALEKLDELILSLDAKSQPEMVDAVINSLSKLNQSHKGNTIFAPKETDEERRARENANVMKEMMK